jgi:hypothetical protein
VLAENTDGKLSPKQVKFAETIYSAGTDLLALINDILDLSKIESGMMAVEVEDVLFSDVRDYVLRTFRHVAEGKGLQINVNIDEKLPKVMATDNKRLQQVLKNLLSNALKFTEFGSVQLSVRRVESGWNRENEVLNSSRNVIAFEVKDTGIGIPEDKQQIIWEAFRQADGTTSRKYGGTGLGYPSAARSHGCSVVRSPFEHAGGWQRIHHVPAGGLHPNSEERRRQQARAALARNTSVEERPQRGAELGGRGSNETEAAAVVRLRLRLRSSTTCAGRTDCGAAAGFTDARRASIMLVSDIGDDRVDGYAGRQGPADYRRRRPVYPPSDGARSGARVQMRSGASRRQGLEPGSGVAAGSDHARYPPARHGRLAGAEPVEV